PPWCGSPARSPRTSSSGRRSRASGPGGCGGAGWRGRAGCGSRRGGGRAASPSSPRRTCSGCPASSTFSPRTGACTAARWRSPSWRAGGRPSSSRARHWAWRAARGCATSARSSVIWTVPVPATVRRSCSRATSTSSPADPPGRCWPGVSGTPSRPRPRAVRRPSPPAPPAGASTPCSPTRRSRSRAAGSPPAARRPPPTTRGRRTTCRWRRSCGSARRPRRTAEGAAEPPGARASDDGSVVGVAGLVAHAQDEGDEAADERRDRQEGGPPGDLPVEYDRDQQVDRAADQRDPGALGERVGARQRRGRGRDEVAVLVLLRGVLRRLGRLDHADAGEAPGAVVALPRRLGGLAEVLLVGPGDVVALGPGVEPGDDLGPDGVLVALGGGPGARGGGPLAGVAAVRGVERLRLPGGAALA